MEGHRPPKCTGLGGLAQGLEHRASARDLGS